MGFDLRSNIKNKPNAQGTLFRHVGSVIPQLTHRGELIDHGTETGMPPHQEDIYRNEQYIGRKRPMNELAKKAEPGTRIYRGERRGHDLAKELGQRGIGMHWTAQRDWIINHGADDRSKRPVVFEGQITEDAPPMSRSHPSFRDRRAPLEGESEVRYAPGTQVHVGVAHVWTGDPARPGVFAPGSDRHDPQWETQPIHAAVPVRNRGHIDYPDVPRHGTTPPPTSKYPSEHRNWQVGQRPLFEAFDHDWTWKQDEDLEPYTGKG